MTDSPEDALKPARHEVQRLLGQCLLRLQVYERLMKVLWVEHVNSGPVTDIEANRAARLEGVSRNTLGMLARAFVGSYLVDEDGKTVSDAEADSAGKAPWVSFRFAVELASADYAQAERDIRELVELRNRLVHRFIEDLDFDSLDGCRRGQEALVATSNRIGESYERLKGWAEDMRKTKEVLQSDEVREVVINELMAALPGGDRRH